MAHGALQCIARLLDRLGVRTLLRVEQAFVVLTRELGIDRQPDRRIRLTARQILLDAHAANNVNFQTDYDKRVEKIGAVVDGCSLLLEYLTICTEEGIISAKKAGIWTKKVTDVKYPAMKWLTSERGRAEKLRAEAERKRMTEQAAALKAVLYPEP